MRSRLKKVLEAVAFVLLAGVVLSLTWWLVRTIKIDKYRLAFMKSGFPESYASELAVLKYDYPRWQFDLRPIGDIAWNEIVERECSPSWNLVIYSSWAPEGWRQYGVTNYTPYYAANAKAYDSGAWYQASRETIAYFMDPRNFLNEREVFMFETLGHDEETDAEETVERVLAPTFMAKANYDGGNERFARLIADVGRRLGVSSVFLASRLASEQGAGSPQSFGTIGDSLTSLYTNGSDRVGNAVVWGKTFKRDGANTAAVVAKGKDCYNGYYNFFNFRAYGTGVFEIRYNAWREATSKETCERYHGPWNTQRRAIEGGSKKIKEMYVDTSRHTRYFQKFSVLPQAGKFRWKQYMQNIAAPLLESRNTSRAYEAMGLLKTPHRFEIPVYMNMPPRRSPDPAGGRSVYSSSR